MAIENEHMEKPDINIWIWIFKPFQYIAGGKALLFGVVIIAAASIIASFSNSHFDGVLDFHTGVSAPLWILIAEPFSAWLVLSIFLTISGLILSKSRIRIIDVFGTQALARFPTVITALASLLPGNKQFIDKLTATPSAFTALISQYPFEFVQVIVTSLIAIVMIIWMVILMYFAFSISCNIQKTKAIVTFIFVLILSEMISKIPIVYLLQLK